MGWKIGKNIIKNLSSKYSQKLLDHAKQSPQKEQFKKIAEATGDIDGNKIADKITRASKTSPQNNSEKMKKKYLEKDIYLQN